MTVNQILPFATGDGANVLLPTDYATAGYLQQGFQNGILEPYDLNVVLRQATFVAAMVAQFTADNANVDVLDNGDVAALEASFTAALRGSLGSAVPYYVRDTSATANRITVSLPGLPNLSEGTAVLVRVAQANTGPTTFRLNTRPSVAITRPDGKPLAGGALAASSIVLLVFGTENTMQLVGEVSPPPSTSLWHYGVDTGAVNALVAAPKPAVPELVPGTVVLVRPATTNTGAATLDIGFGTAPIVRGTNTALTGGDLTVGVLTALGFDGVSWQIGLGGAFGGALPLVERPTNISPANGATNVGQTPTLTGSTFRSLYGLAQGSSRFRIATDPAMTGIILDQTITGAGTVFTVPGGTLSANGTFYWDVGYTDANGVASARSIPTGFATQTTFAYVAAPTNVSPADGAQGVSLSPVFRSSAFATVGQSDTQTKAQWQIARDVSFANPVYDSGETTDLIQHTVTSVLSTQVEYFWRVRHRGTALGYGAFSQPTTFRAQARPDRPVITAPVDGATGVSLRPTVTTSAFSMPGGGVQSALQVQISTASSFASILHDSGDVGSPASLTSYQLPAGLLTFNTPYFARARHKETGGSYSPWSNVVAFSTMATTNVSDVFGPVLFAGGNANRTVTIGPDLTQGGMLLTGGNLNGFSSALTLFDTTRGIGSIGTPTKAKRISGAGLYSAETSPIDMLGSLTPSSFTAGPGFAPGGYIAYPFRVQAGFFAEARVNHQSGTADTIDLSSLGTVGMIWAFGLNVEQEFCWHRGVPNQNQPPFRSDQATETNVFLTVNGTTATLSANAPSGSYMLYGYAHNESPTGIIKCISFLTIAGTPTPIDTGWSNGIQFLYLNSVGTPFVGSSYPACMIDTVRSPGFVGPERQLTYLGYEQSQEMVTMNGGMIELASLENNIRRYIAMMVRAPS